MSHWKSHMRNICRIANTNYSNSLVKIMMVGSYKLSFFVCVIRGQKKRAGSCDGRRPFFADDFSAAEIILLAKYGQAKIAWSNFSVRCSHRFFRGHKSGSKNAVNFLDHDGPKKGCNPALRRSVLPLYVAKRCQRCKNVYSLAKSNRNSR